jgi:hypothetical protein
MTDQAAPVRPMGPADYREGDPVRVTGSTRDIVLGAVIGAAALWAVPKILDYVLGGVLGDGDSVELEFEQ